jgi:RNA polymerase sigma-70 factor, ECF subfamily
LPSWLYTLTRNAIIDHYRSHKPTAELSADLAEQLPELASDEAEQIRTELAQCLAPMIEALPEVYRSAVVLSEIQGLAQQEVAQRLDLSLSGAKSRVQRGRHKLKDMLLDCCRFELGHRNEVLGYEPKRRACRSC